MPKRSRATPALSVIDRDWPHQVALPDDLCVDRNLTRITEFCKAQGIRYLTRKVQATWPDGKYEEWRLHCFADLAAASTFLDQFGGIMFDPKRDREKGRARGVWRRTGQYERILHLGPPACPRSCVTEIAAKGVAQSDSLL